MPTRPLVSVLTPTFNGAGFVAETIESVLAQTYEPIEHVIVDDASSDGTVEIVQEYVRRYPDRIRLLRKDERAGPCRRRNDALDAAQGSFLAWLDHDDLWLPEKIERQVGALEADPGAGFAYTQYESFDDSDGRTIHRSDISVEGDALERLFVEGCLIASSTVVMRREALNRRGLGFRDTDFSFGDDYFLWLALSLDWRLVRVDEVLARLRRHDRNESTRLARDNWLVATTALLDEFVRTFPDAKDKLGPARRVGLARHWAWAALYELQSGRRLRAARHGARAAAMDPVGAGRYAFRRARRRPALLNRVRA